MDKRVINEHYAEIGQDLIEHEPMLEHILHSEASIVYLSSEHKKKNGERLVLGQCEKVAEKYKWGIPADFTVTIFEPNIEGFSEEQLRILILHELLHIEITYNNDGEEKYSCKGHDLEDFKLIIDRYGTGWANV